MRLRLTRVGVEVEVTIILEKPPLYGSVALSKVITYSGCLCRYAPFFKNGLFTLLRYLSISGLKFLVCRWVWVVGGVG